MRHIDNPSSANILPGDCIVATPTQRAALSIGPEDAGKVIVEKSTGRMYLATMTEGAKPLSANLSAELAAIGSPAVRGGVAMLYFGHSFLDNENTTATFGRMISSMRAPINLMNIRLGHPLELVAEEAVGGERLRDMQSRIDRVAAKNPCVVFVRMGTNDLKGTVNGSPRDYDGYVYPTDLE